MILHRVFPWDRRAADTAAGGALFIARELQGAGRHDNPALYGCMYVAERPVAAVAEALAPFRGTGALLPSMLTRGGRPLARAAIALDGRAAIVDLDDPAVLVRERLRPSRVATRDRSVTQPQAARIFKRRRSAAGLRWWSTLEALWANVTLFDRVAERLTVEDIAPLGPGDLVVREAAELFGLRV